jgi:peroxiredoxin
MGIFRPSRLCAPLLQLAMAASTAVCMPAAGGAGVELRFALHDTEGAVHDQNEWAGARAVVIFFITTDCPLSNGYAPEMNRIEEEYAPRGVRFYGVQGDTSVADDEVRRHTREFAYRFPILFDPAQSLSQHTGATITPEVAVLAPSGEVLYLGRIDNRVEDWGKVRYQATVFDLRDALSAVLAGRPVLHPRTRAFGCSITDVH